MSCADVASWSFSRHGGLTHQIERIHRIQRIESRQAWNHVEFAPLKQRASPVETTRGWDQCGGFTHFTPSTRTGLYIN